MRIRNSELLKPDQAIVFRFTALIDHPHPENGDNPHQKGKPFLTKISIPF
jgi:hypothetical protein